jgi:hypothetical protein
MSQRTRQCSTCYFSDWERPNSACHLCTDLVYAYWAPKTESQKNEEVKNENRRREKKA